MHSIYFHYFFNYVSIPDTPRCAVISATHRATPPQVRNSVACAPGKLGHVATWQKAIVGDNVASTMRNSSAPSHPLDSSSLLRRTMQFAGEQQRRIKCKLFSSVQRADSSFFAIPIEPNFRSALVKKHVQCKVFDDVFAGIAR